MVDPELDTYLSDVDAVIKNNNIPTVINPGDLDYHKIIRDDNSKWIISKSGNENPNTKLTYLNNDAVNETWGYIQSDLIVDNQSKLSLLKNKYWKNTTNSWELETITSVDDGRLLTRDSYISDAQFPKEGENDYLSTGNENLSKQALEIKDFTSEVEDGNLEFNRNIFGGTVRHNLLDTTISKDKSWKKWIIF